MKNIKQNFPNDHEQEKLSPNIQIDPKLFQQVAKDLKNYTIF